MHLFLVRLAAIVFGLVVSQSGYGQTPVTGCGPCSGTVALTVNVQGQQVFLEWTTSVTPGSDNRGVPHFAHSQLDIDLTIAKIERDGVREHHYLIVEFAQDEILSRQSGFSKPGNNSSTVQAIEGIIKSETAADSVVIRLPAQFSYNVDYFVVHDAGEICPGVTDPTDPYVNGRAKVRVGDGITESRTVSFGH